MVRKDGKRSGIQRRYLKYTAALLGLALLLSSLGVGLSVRDRLTRSIIDKYEFMTERMGLALENMFRRTDETTAECILYDDVQQSLRTQGLEDVRHIALSKYFAYIDLDHVADYCYVDNKGNVYSRSYSDVSYEDVEESGFERYLGEEYSRTKWFWTKDTLFGTGDDALFIGRYVRSLEYAHEPGMLFFKMEDGFLREIAGISPELEDEAAVGIVDGEGQVCLSLAPGTFREGESVAEDIGEMVGADARAGDGEGTSGMLLSGERVKGGVLSAYRDASSGLTVFSFVPDRVLNQGIIPVFLVLAGIYLLVTAAAFVVSIYFSKRFTKPIRTIREAMTGFDGTNFERTIELHTNTELDEIGNSYNEMLQNIRRLLDEIKAFLYEEFCVAIPDVPYAILPQYLHAKLNRPVRVCGMVRNEGEPGGGPYIVYDADGATSLQILEGAQLDMNDPATVAMLKGSTHFNPVDVVCCTVDYLGRKFDLQRFVDPETGFISHKSYEGRPLKAQELPGLWNGSMSNWNTVFVEVPLVTFNPVKTVLDLLRPEHQPEAL